MPRLELEAWRARFGVTAGIKTRGADGGYTLGLWSGSEPVDAAMRRWVEFRGAFAPGFEAVVLSRQVHGDRVRWQGPGAAGLVLLDGYDGHATAEAGVLLAVSVADCVPVYLVEPRSQTLAVLHAGWRGTAAGILEAGMARMAERAGVSRSDIVMHCGVSICGSCYEVGSEVILNVTGRHVENPEPLDLRAELVLRANRQGVAEVTVSPHCAAHDPDRFHSHRASGGRAGRVIAYIGRPASGA